MQVAVNHALISDEGKGTSHRGVTSLTGGQFGHGEGLDVAVHGQISGKRIPEPIDARRGLINRARVALQLLGGDDVLPQDVEDVNLPQRQELRSHVLAREVDSHPANASVGGGEAVGGGGERRGGRGRQGRGEARGGNVEDQSVAVRGGQGQVVPEGVAAQGGVVGVSEGHDGVGEAR